MKPVDWAIISISGGIIGLWSCCLVQISGSLVEILHELKRARWDREKEAP